MVINKFILTKKRKEEIDKIVQHAKIDADDEIEKWIKELFPNMNKEERYKLESLCEAYYNYYSDLLERVSILSNLNSEDGNEDE